MPGMGARVGSQAAMSEPASLGEATTGPLRPVAGLSLLGAGPGSAFAEPRVRVRGADGQVIPLARLPYLAVVAVTEAAAVVNDPVRTGGMRTGRADAELIA